jgi:ABC-type transport system involved in multi-copper enzyme maturation permease subunit
MTLWKAELIHLFRSWRGWTLVGIYLLACFLASIVGYFIERATGSFTHTGAIDIYIAASIVGLLLFVGIVVSSLAFDSNKDASIFLRTRFSMKQILVAKILVYFPLSSALFFFGFLLTLIIGLLIFDSSDPLNWNWFMWGFLLEIVAGIFYVPLMLFTSSIFRGSVASVLLTLAVMIGIPAIGATLITVELLMRGLIETPPAQWETVSYVAQVLLWWPAALSDTQAFLTVTESEITAGTITFFGQTFELDAHFRWKPLVTTIISGPILTLLAWYRYSRREI